MRYITAGRIGKTLAKARNEAGLTQRAIAEQLGISKATVQSWENGQTSPNCDDLMEWFVACKVSPLAYFQEMLYPELYAQPLDQQQDRDLEDVLMVCIRRTPIAVKRMLLYIFMGKHGSYPPAVIAEICANLHTPLKDRVSVCGQIIDNYNCARATGTDPVPDGEQPPIEDLTQTYKAGRAASQSGAASYIKCSVQGGK